jgi:membrane-bound ClpP family serine protease
MIDGTFYEALSAGNYIEKGEKIEVIRHEGSVIIVDVIRKFSSEIGL